MSPPEQQLITLVLQLIMPALEEIRQLLPHEVWITFIHHFFKICFLHIICQQGKRLRIWWLCNFPEEILTKLILFPWVLKKRGLGLDIKNAFVPFSNMRGVQEASLRQIFVGCILF